MDKKHLVLIAYYFPPYNIIAAQRAAKLAIGLADNKFYVTVLTLDESFIHPDKIDREFSKEVYSHPYINIQQIPLWGMGYENPEQANTFSRLLSGFLSRTLCSNGIFWYPSLKRKLNRMLADGEVHKVLATGSPFLPFYLLYKLNKRKKLRYIIDYRDLWTGNPRAPYFGWARKMVGRTLEKRSLQKADGILTVSDGCAASLNVAPGIGLKKAIVVRNLPDAAYKEYFHRNCTDISHTQPKICFVFSGTVYKTCTFSSILSALAQLDESMLGRIEFHYCGTSSGMVQDEFDEAGFSHLLINYGYIKKAEAFEILKKASVLISLIDDGRLEYDASIAGLMTTKVFDYFLTGKPILNIGPKGCNTETFANEIEYPSFHSFEGKDISGIGDFIKKIIFSGNVQFENWKVSLPDFSSDLKKAFVLFES